ncbi:uncharacterized protein BDV17DRAFT_279021 [Aspergillus undulatus]|uniref:uncharacterized protein n=1 Tax=Aspergillus undulatus TaxID=1810928 RepID=UPI003CCD3C40
MSVVVSPVPVGPVGQPDIQYLPGATKYAARTKRRQQLEDLAKMLPEGFPQGLSSNPAWDGKDLAHVYDWNYHLTEDDLKEVEQACTSRVVSQETFQLPKLHETLRFISKEVPQGRVFKVVRGVPVDQHTREEDIIIYAGQRHQGKPADVVLAHITDLSRNVDTKTIKASAYTTEKQVFRTDSGDIITLFALVEAAEGGQSYLSSSWHVYNELARTRPDLIRTLAEPRVLGQPRSATLPPITEAQTEALDALHYLAEKSAVSLDFHKGDIQVRRHPVRLWLRDAELAWETPEGLRSRWEHV